MVGQVGKSSMPGMADSAANVAPQGGVAISGVSNGVVPQADSQHVSTEPKFGKVFSEMQAKYGAKAEKPREIKKTLGKDDFLRIMITQMRHQDPTNPFKAEQFASEVAQFTNVEQLQNLNQKMEKMTNANQPLERLAMTNMIGKTITVDRERFVHTEGQNEALPFVLSKDAANVKAVVVSDAGEVVYETDLGALKKGENTLSWDGLKTNTLRAKTGSYQVKIDAKDANGVTIPGQTQVKTRVSGVSFEGSEPVFLVGDINRPEKVAMKNIVRIEADGAAPSLTGAGKPPAAGIAAINEPATGEPMTSEPVEPQKNSNYFTFQKGVGSMNLDPGQLPPDAARALEKYQTERALAKAADEMKENAKKTTELAQANTEKGFPNGMSEYNQDGKSKGGEKK